MAKESDGVSSEEDTFSSWVEQVRQDVLAGKAGFVQDEASWPILQDIGGNFQAQADEWV